MASNALGLPQIMITFSSKSATAITRSSRGVAALIINDANVKNGDGVLKYTIQDTTDIPEKLSEASADLIKKALLGTPSKVYVYAIPFAQYEEEQERQVESDVLVTDAETGATDTVTSEVTVTETVTVQATVKQVTALTALANVRCNYVCHPTGSVQDQQDLASWVKSQRDTKRRTVKAVVANYAADNYGVVNFTTGGIKVDNPAYAEALEIAESEEEVTVPQYITYTATQYTARIAGILAGIGLDRSATYYELTEVASVDDYDDIDTHINNGELCLFDEKDDNGVKIARGVNSLTTFTGDTGADFRFIKNVEGMDIIHDDIRDTFRDGYVGKVANSYDNKMLFISAILTYFSGLAGTVLDNSANNTVAIDYNANYEYAKNHQADVENLTEQEILRFNTGTNVYLSGKIKLLNAMEDLKLNFSLD